MKLLEIARSIGATAENVPAELEITGMAGVEEASPTQLTFLSNPKYTPAAAKTRAAAIIVSPDFPANGHALLRSENPHLAYAKALELFYSPPVTRRASVPLSWEMSKSFPDARARAGGWNLKNETA